MTRPLHIDQIAEFPPPGNPLPAGLPVQPLPGYGPEDASMEGVAATDVDRPHDSSTRA